MQVRLLAKQVIVEGLEGLMPIRVHRLLVPMVLWTQEDSLKPFPGKSNVMTYKNMIKGMSEKFIPVDPIFLRKQEDLLAESDFEAVLLQCFLQRIG